MRANLTEAGMKRAAELGWPNTYTLTKSLAESLMKYGAGLPIAVVRPAIVETSVDEAVCGWNEGINTSASLSYLLGTYFRQLPTNEHKRLDIIPVDLGLPRHDPDRRGHRGTAARSALSAGDVGDQSLRHAAFHRTDFTGPSQTLPRAGGLEYWLRLRFDAIPVSKERYNRMSAPAQKAIVKSIQRIMSPLPLKKTPLAQPERNLEKVEKLIKLFEPFILHNEQDFAADNVGSFPTRWRRREGSIRIQHAADRLVGLLDQYSHSGAAQVDLSSD